MKTTSKKQPYRHYVPAKKELDNYPFSYSITPIKDQNIDDFLLSNPPRIVIDYYTGENLKKKIKDELIKIFPFSKYMDKHLDTYIGKSGNSDLSYIIKIVVYELQDYLAKTGKTKQKYVVKETWAVRLSNFKTEYSFSLIRSIDQLNNILSVNPKRIAFDSETTGLDPELDKIVGASFSFKEKEGYYVPLFHSSEFSNFNLGFEALDIIYSALVKASIVDMFNARFDMRVMEYCEKEYDMSKVNVRDAQITTWYADPDYNRHDLKTHEKRFRGYVRPNLQETLKNVGINDFSVADISPENIQFYACQDSISTFEIGLDTDVYYKEFKLSAEIDHKLLYPLMKMENEPNRIDIKYVKKQLDYIKPRLAELDSSIKRQIGDVNLNSPKQKINLIKSFGLDTGMKTKTGAMSTNKEAVENLISKLEKQNKEIPLWLSLINERSKLQQLSSTFFGSLYDQAKESGGRVRINYRNTQVSTGRLSSGKDINEI